MNENLALYAGSSQTEEEDVFSIPSSQNHMEQPKTEKPQEKRAKQTPTWATPPSRKIKYSETASLEAKITKTKDSIKKLKRHTENKTCPKSLQYAARTNIPPDDEFKNEIKAIKQTAEQAFVHALSKFHHRRLGRQESQLSKKSQSAPKSKGFNKPLQERNVTTAKAKSAARTNNLEQIQEQLNEMREMMYKMQKCVNNKTVEHYHCLFSEYSTTETGLSKKQKSVTNPKKAKIQSKKRKERRKIALVKRSLKKTHKRETHKKSVKPKPD